jgi:hypothetical protein
VQTPNHPRGGAGSRGDFDSGNARARPLRSVDDPVACGGGRKANAGGQRADQKIFQPRVPSRCPELQDFDQAGEGDGNCRHQQPASRVGHAEGQAQQHESKRVFTVMPKAKGHAAGNPEAQVSQTKSLRPGTILGMIVITTG